MEASEYRRARGWATTATLSKRVADYVDHPVAGERCGRCAMFRRPDRCTLVIGVISPSGWCRHFARRSR